MSFLTFPWQHNGVHTGPLHPKGNVRVPLLQEVIIFSLDVHSVGVSEYGHYTAQVSLSHSGATYKTFFILEGRGLVTSMLLW